MGQIFTPDAVTFTRPANVDAYTAQEVVGINLAVTGATNASPIVITTAAHGLATGDVVTIASVGGNTAANGTFRVTVVSSTTFQLDGSTGNGSYTSGGTVAKWLRMKNVTSEGGSGILRGWKLSTNSTNVTNASFSLVLLKGGSTNYQIPPAATLDNAAFALDAYTNHSYLVHKTASASITAATLGTSSGWCEAHNLGIPYDLVGTSKDLWVQVIAEAAYTPASAQTFAVSIDVEK